MALAVKNLPANARNKRHQFDPWVRKTPWRRKWQSTPVLLPGESHGQRSLVGCSPQGCKELDTNWSDFTHMHATGKEAMSSNLYECNIDMRKMYHNDTYVSTENQEQSRKSARIHPVCLGGKALNLGKRLY